MSPTTDEVVYIGMKGHVLAINRRDGLEVWRRRLKGSGFVNIVIDRGDLFAATKGELFCLDPESGQILWKNPLRGMGYDLITFASGSASAVLHAEQQQENQQQMVHHSGITAG